jgi:ATPase subunit of ABC transporter with duplicated ATPase domains
MIMHRPISLTTLGLTFPQKVCFTGFSAQIHYGMRIAIIGRNGCGKSTLLKMLQGYFTAFEGEICVPQDICFGYVPQETDRFAGSSGGQRLNEALTQALAKGPNVLLLDEPTNHLDTQNRRSLMRLLQKFPGTLIVISHDPELLRTGVDTLWHIDQGKVTVFSGNYEDYEQDIRRKRSRTEEELRMLDRQKKQTHTDLMKEQARAKKSRSQGEKHITQRKWPTVVSGAKARRAEQTSGLKKKEVHHKKEELLYKLSEVRLPEILMPKFSLQASEINPSKTIMSIQDGSCGYDSPFLEGIFLSLSACGRLAVTGNNGSGKSTLAKAILNEGDVTRGGDWATPRRDDIGYLDQHYATLPFQKSVLETIQALAPAWSLEEVRRHLNDFLFRKNEEVTAFISTLSGGEKARLSLAQIAAKPPKLLILDEITNNLDLETRTHVAQVLKTYPGAMIVISHDTDFLKEIGVQEFYHLGEKKKR